LNQALVEVIDGFSLVSYHTLDITDEESLNNVLMQIDNMVQYDDYRMPNDKKFLDEQDENGNEEMNENY
jgi:GPN-loop GTPase